MKAKWFLNLCLAIALLMPASGFAQCKAFTKKVCNPILSPYTHNGQLNSAILAEGETAELLLTFYAGQNYRVAVCAQEVIGDVEFRLMDANRNLIFDNTQHDMANSWDFNVKSTQQIIVEINVPKRSESGKAVSMVPTGCVSILVGFKE
ncbi:MAG: hypothetical protein H6585_13805 [Flavobacteriales bacterium]|nr:hypothetical protein [Flavobacteriales bacterium]MCB9449404.1 hypothetical protein [Flavobacteriales bacterium]